MVGPPLISEEKACELDLAERDLMRELIAKGLRRLHAACPCVQLIGPLVHVVIDPGSASYHHPLGRGRNNRGDW